MVNADRTGHAKLETYLSEDINNYLAKLSARPHLLFEDDIARDFSDSVRNYLVNFKNLLYSLGDLTINNFLYIGKDKEKRQIPEDIKKSFVIDYTTTDKKTGISSYNNKHVSLEDMISVSELLHDYSPYLSYSSDINLAFSEQDKIKQMDLLQGVTDAEFTLVNIPEIRNERYDVEVHKSFMLVEPIYPSKFVNSAAYRNGEYILWLAMRSKRRKSLADKIFDATYKIGLFGDVLNCLNINSKAEALRQSDEIENLYMAAQHYPVELPQDFKRSRAGESEEKIGDPNGLQIVFPSDGLHFVFEKILPFYVNRFNLSSEMVKYYLKSRGTEKPNGYESIHVQTPFAELQLRTEAMHDHAERRAASHNDRKKARAKHRDIFLYWYEKAYGSKYGLSQRDRKKPATFRRGLEETCKEDIDRYAMAA